MPSRIILITFWACCSTMALVCPLIGNKASALTITEAYERIMEKEPHMRRHQGRVCEHLAQLHMEEKFSTDEYEIRMGVPYFLKDRMHARLGELDIVILRKSDGKLVQIAEVKCGSNLERLLKSGRQGALSTLKKFRQYYEESRKRLVYSIRSNRSKELVEFPEPSRQTQYITIGQQGALKAGFDEEFDMSLSDIHLLNQMFPRVRKL